MLIQRIKSTKYSKDDQAIVECEICKQQRTVRWHSVWSKQNHYCRKCIPTIKLTGKKHSLGRRLNQSKSLQKSGGGWRMQEGYKQINMFGKIHPRIEIHKKGSYVMEHILVMEKYLGRFLKSIEMVHHIDEDRSNNDISNLYLCSGETITESRRMHNAIHQSAEDVAIKLYKTGLIKFENGKYIMSDELATLAAKIL